MAPVVSDFTFLAQKPNSLVENKENYDSENNDYVIEFTGVRKKIWINYMMLKFWGELSY